MNMMLSLDEHWTYHGDQLHQWAKGHVGRIPSDPNPSHLGGQARKFPLDVLIGLMLEVKVWNR